MGNCIRVIVTVIILFASGIVPADTQTAKATFAGGCFWCMEEPFDRIEGVLSTTSGFTGGGSEPPTYEKVASGSTGHMEAVEIVYDPTKVNYEKLLEVYWRNIDPTDTKGQFCDRGVQYRAAIFYHDEQQKKIAEESKLKIEEILKKTIDTPVLQATAFFHAGAGHQDFYKKKALQYKQYKIRCGRDRRLRELWKDQK